MSNEAVCCKCNKFGSGCHACEEIYRRMNTHAAISAKQQQPLYGSFFWNLGLGNVEDGNNQVNLQHTSSQATTAGEGDEYGISRQEENSQEHLSMYHPQQPGYGEVIHELERSKQERIAGDNGQSHRSNGPSREQTQVQSEDGVDVGRQFPPELTFYFPYPRSLTQPPPSQVLQGNHFHDSVNEGLDLANSQINGRNQSDSQSEAMIDSVGGQHSSSSLGFPGSKGNYGSMSRKGKISFGPSHINVIEVKIGDWIKRPSEVGLNSPEECVAKFLYRRRMFVWEFSRFGEKQKMEIGWDNVVGIDVRPVPGTERATMIIELKNPPLFYTGFQLPKKNTKWNPTQCADFTNRNAVLHRFHLLTFRSVKCLEVPMIKAQKRDRRIGELIHEGIKDRIEYILSPDHSKFNAPASRAAPGSFSVPTEHIPEPKAYSSENIPAPKQIQDVKSLIGWTKAASRWIDSPLRNGNDAAARSRYRSRAASSELSKSGLVDISEGTWADGVKALNSITNAIIKGIKSLGIVDQEQNAKDWAGTIFEGRNHIFPWILGGLWAKCIEIAEKIKLEDASMLVNDLSKWQDDIHKEYELHNCTVHGIARTQKCFEIAIGILSELITSFDSESDKLNSQGDAFVSVRALERTGSARAHTLRSLFRGVEFPRDSYFKNAHTFDPLNPKIFLLDQLNVAHEISTFAYEQETPGVFEFNVKSLVRWLQYAKECAEALDGCKTIEILQRITETVSKRADDFQIYDSYLGGGVWAGVAMNGRSFVHAVGKVWVTAIRSLITSFSREDVGKYHSDLLKMNKKFSERGLRAPNGSLPFSKAGQLLEERMVQIEEEYRASMKASLGNGVIPVPYGGRLPAPSGEGMDARSQPIFPPPVGYFGPPSESNLGMVEEPFIGQNIHGYGNPGGEGGYYSMGRKRRTAPKQNGGVEGGNDDSNMYGGRDYSTKKARSTVGGPYFVGGVFS